MKRGISSLKMFCEIEKWSLIVSRCTMMSAVEGNRLVWAFVRYAFRNIFSLMYGVMSIKYASFMV